MVSVPEPYDLRTCRTARGVVAADATAVEHDLPRGAHAEAAARVLRRVAADFGVDERHDRPSEIQAGAAVAHVSNLGCAAVFPEISHPIEGDGEAGDGSGTWRRPGCRRGFH